MLRITGGDSKQNKKVRFHRIGEEAENSESEILRESEPGIVELELSPVNSESENIVITDSKKSTCSENSSDATCGSIDQDQLGTERESQSHSETKEEAASPMSHNSGPSPRESDPLLLSQSSISTYSVNFGTSSSLRASRLSVNDGKPHCCAVCCSIFSSIGVAFLCSLGAYAAAGWNYIEGVNWSSQQQSVVARNAFIGAFLYLVTLCVSLFCWVRTARNSVSLRSGRLFRNGYERYRDLDE